MTDESPESLERNATLHEVCDAFARAWSRDGRPELTEFVTRYPDFDPETLLRELLPIELEQRRQAGEIPELEDYRSRFPTADDLLEEVFATSRTITLATGTVSPEAGRSDPAPLGVFGEYDLLEEVGRGGMGVVYRARQRGLNRVVAVKMTRSGDRAHGEELARFQSEAAAVARLDHPGIVPIHEVGEHDGQHYFSMGYVDGPSLSELLRDGPLEPRRATELGKRIAEAVAYAHERGIVHRDLKPGNVLLAADGAPRVTDFGLAKQLDSDSRMTVTNQVLGTPSFMPPEQALGQPVGPSADVYSLGAMFYCLVTGRPPFQAATTMETLRQVVEVEPVPPRRLNPAVGPDLETIVLRCLEKAPSRRYTSMTTVAEELGRVLAGEPILARPVGPLERFTRWCRRQPRLATATIGVVLATLACLVILAVAVVRVGAARNSALEIARRNGRLLEVFQMERESNAEANRRRLDDARRQHVATLTALAVASLDEQRLDHATRRRLADTLSAIVARHPETVAAILDESTTRLATGESSGTVRLWDFERNREIDNADFGDRAVRRIAFRDAEPTTLLVVTDDGSQHDWSPQETSDVRNRR